MIQIACIYMLDYLPFMSIEIHLHMYSIIWDSSILSIDYMTECIAIQTRFYCTFELIVIVTWRVDLHIDVCIKFTCNITRAFSMDSSSDGKPSDFQISCSLSVLRNRRQSKCCTPRASDQVFIKFLRTSSGAWAR